MKNCEIKSPPVFAADVPRWDRETDADGDDMGLVVEQVFNNTIYNKQKAEQALGILLPGRMILRISRYRKGDFGNFFTVGISQHTIITGYRIAVRLQHLSNFSA